MKKVFCDNCKNENESQKPLGYQFGLQLPNGKFINLEIKFFNRYGSVQAIFDPADLCNECRQMIIEKVLKKEFVL